jgi:hypothetical protein
MIRLVTLLALAGVALAPAAAAPPAAAKRALKPGPAKCTVNDEQARPCTIRRSEGGGLDVETTGDEPLLAMVIEDGLNLFALIGDKDRVPLIMDYARDGEDPRCWRAAESDAVVWRLCVR